MHRMVGAMAVAAALAGPAALAPFPAGAQDNARTLKVVVHANLQILDPVWTTAYITGRHAYLIYDTLYSMNSEFEPKPQMAEGHEVLEDGLLYRIRLRSGLKFSDGAPVRAQDAVASLKRWMQRDPMGLQMARVTESVSAVDERTLEIRLKERWGMVLDALAKPTNGPFIMPERVAQTPVGTQITETIGSGPFVFVREEWRPGNRVVYRRNPDYVPREEPADYLSGGKRALVDRVEWLYIPDHNTALAALNAGEIDYFEAPPLDFIPVLQRNRNIRIVDIDPLGTQGLIRPNHLYPPFNDARARQAVAHLLQQEDFMRVVVANPQLYHKFCGAFFMCGSPNGTEAGSESFRKPDVERARQLLREAGYNGEPVVVLQPTDREQYKAATMVLVQALRRAGVNVDVQAMDWSTVLSRRASRNDPYQGVYHLFITTQGGPTAATPPANSWFNTSCDKANPGWACDEEMTRLVGEWARESDTAKRRPVLEQIHRRAWETLPYIPYGQYTQPIAIRSNIHGVLVAGLPIYWNIEKR
jgi:peptide/nickel transport system substrate-binding protein